MTPRLRTERPQRWAALRGLRARWAFVSATTLLYWIVNQALRPFVPLRLQELGASDLTIGVAVAAYSVSALLLALPSGRLLDRVSLRRSLVVSLVAMAGVTAALAGAPAVWAVVALLVVNGVAAMVTWIALQSLITNAGDGEVRRQQLALFSLGWGVGLAAGPSIGAVLFETVGFGGLCLILGSVTLLAAAAGVAGPDAPRVAAEAEEPGGPAAPREGFARTLLREMDNPALMSVLLSSFVNLYVQSMRTSFYPVYLERVGVSVTQIGVLLSIIGVASLAVRAILPALERSVGPVRVLTWSTWVAIVGMAATPFLTASWLLVAGALCIGVGLGASPPITVQLVAEQTPVGERGLAMGMRTVANRSAQAAQPLVFGGISSFLGLPAAFPASGGLLAAMALWMSLRLRRIGRT